MHKISTHHGILTLIGFPLVALIWLGGVFLLDNPSVYGTEWAQVRWINDGDTVILTDDRRVRYIGIDTPEIEHVDKGQAAEPYADEALNHNKKLVFRKQVRLEFDKEKHDHYGRLLAYVYLADGTLVNAAMLQEGYAHVLPKSPNNRHQTILLKAQREAMAAGKGMWQQWREPGEGYLGNRRSKRFHQLHCASAKRIHPKNQIYFTTRWDAFWAGYAPVKNCRP
jgi:endonuclease YncB( thermonuclease family)